MKKFIIISILIFDLIILSNPNFIYTIFRFDKNPTLELNKETIKNSDKLELDSKKENPQLSLPTSDYDWWNSLWYYRIPIEISSEGAQQDAPVELQINFTTYFNGLNIENPWLDNESIRVVEYFSESSYTEIECEFEEWLRSYDPQTNAIGDVVWILNGTTSAGAIRDFFIYFNNGTDSGVPLSETDLRIWHEGFEQYRSGDILSVIAEDLDPNYWEISNSTSARGSSSLHIWGNTWKARSTGNALFDNYNNPDARLTAKMRFDDPPYPQREVSGLGFHDSTSSPSSSEFYNIRGNQYWGNDLYRNLYYQPSTFFWYTFENIPHDEYIIFVGDDDAYTERQLYWDDISAWDYAVQTDPEYMLSITTGDVEVIDFMLTIVAKDDNGGPVPGAFIYITNDIQHSINQYDISDDNGKVIFSDINKNDIYNITINYTQIGLPDPETKTVYYRKNYQIQKLSNLLVVWLNLSTYEFNITDIDGIPIKYGFVYLKDGATIVGKGALNEKGNTTLRWINDSSYDYEVYYDFNSLPDISEYINPELKIKDTTSIPGPYNNILTGICNITFNMTEYEDKLPFGYAKLRFYNETNQPSNNIPIANITVQPNGFASFISFADGYGNWGNYTVVSYYAGENRFFDWNRDNNFVQSQNFTLETKSYVDLRININKEFFNTTIVITNYTKESLWGTEFSVIFNFTWQSNEQPYPHPDRPNEISVQIFDADLNPFSQKIDILGDIEELGTGKFNYTFNTKKFGLIGGTSYFVKITGTIEGYIPGDDSVLIDVLELPASITFHDYDDPLLEVSSYSECFDELINITVKYFADDTGDPLLGATLNYEWNYGSGSINQDPLNPDYYTFTIDTGDAGSIGNPIINVFASIENYTSYKNYPLVLQILPRFTSINDELHPFDKSYDIYFGQAFNLSFVYKDYERNQILTGLDQAFYEPYLLKSGGVYEPLFEFPINLISKPNNSYVLDFDTENRNVGTYLLRLTISKANYQAQKLDITLHIDERPTSINGITSILNITKEIFGLSAHNFTFEYNDTLVDERISDADRVYYYWDNLNSNDEEIGNPSDNFDLYKTLDNLYILDFNTENRPIGKYRIYVVFNKTNYEPRFVIINLKISKSITIPDLGEDKEDKDDNKDDSSEILVLILIISTISTISVVSMIVAFLIKKRLKILRKA